MLSAKLPIFYLKLQLIDSSGHLIGKSQVFQFLFPLAVAFKQQEK